MLEVEHAGHRMYERTATESNQSKITSVGL